MSRKKISRDCAVDDLKDLHRLQHDAAAPIWDLSQAFLDSDDVDDACYLPLSNVKFNETTKRYHAPEAPNLHEDDWLLQALVMMVIYQRLEHGNGVKTMLRHLSVWEGPDQKKNEGRLTELPNLWEGEIEDLKKTPKEPGSKQMKLGRGLKHQDNFDTFRKFYRDTLPGDTDKWARRPKSSENYWVHLLSEQAAVQWALHIDEESPHLMELAALVIRIQGKQSSDKLEELPNLLREQAERADCDGTFVKLALEAIQKTFAADHHAKKKKRRRV